MGDGRNGVPVPDFVTRSDVVLVKGIRKDVLRLWAFMTARKKEGRILKRFVVIVLDGFGIRAMDDAVTAPRDRRPAAKASWRRILI